MGVKMRIYKQKTENNADYFLFPVLKSCVIKMLDLQ
jgi:hypothetical protein